MTQCPNATLANTEYEFENSTSCWCQYGTNMTEDDSGWGSCLISTLSDQYKADLYTTYGGGQFYLHMNAYTYMHVFSSII